MNKRDRINEQILQHGFNLKRIFFDDPYEGIGPVELAKKVHSIEVKAHKLAEDYCNGLIESDDWYDIKEKKILDRLDKVLNFRERGIPVFVNGDPRGYALEHGCECISPQLDASGEVAFYLFNECASDNRSTFSARTEEELIRKLNERRRQAE